MFSFFQNILPKLHFTVAIVLNLSGCSASTTPQVVSNTSNQSKSTQFLGAKSLSPNEDGTWTLFWQPALGFSNVYYRIFQRQVNELFDYDRPIATTTVSNYTTKDLRLVGNTCYVVRFYQPGNESDKNTTEICTGHEPYSFDGVSSIQSMRDGTYMLRWTPPSFSGARFSILQRKNPKASLEYVGETTQNFFQTSAISLNDRKCFVVRYNIPGFPADNNEKEACTRQTEGELIFAGLKSLSSPDNGKLLIEWEALDASNVAGYYVYLGSEFRPNMRHIKISDPKVNRTLLEDLQHAVVYTIGVRAFDKFGREDQNTTVMSYELKNHITNVRSVTINVKNRNAIGKPTTVDCIADYEDTDTWQTLYPTAWIRNNKRDNLGVVERAILRGSAGQKIFSYTLVGDDQRADEIYCELQVNDGFDDTGLFRSNKLVIPDTPVVATGLNLSTTENTVLDIAITRGEGLGYLDADRDNARAVIFSTEKGAVVSNPPFICIEGTCTGQFKPDKDFFTDLGGPSPEYASIRYQVVAGDSTSNMGEIRIMVRPVPRALGFDFIAQQDEDRSGSIARATEVNSQDQVVKFEAYRHVLNRAATFLYVRQPLYQQDANGVVRLPPGIVENPSLGIGCRATVVSGWTKPGFECGIPCTNGECPFVFRGDNSYYGPSSFDYAVVADGIQSNYASARVSILPNLRAVGFNGLTVEGQSYLIKMSENVGFKGAQNDLQIDRIDIVRTDGNEAAMPVFSESSPGEWTATYVPNVGFNGTAEFEYQLKATKDGRSIESNVGKASIRFYPLPVATGLSLQGIQDTPRSVTVKIGLPSAKAGYAHGDSAKVSKLIIENIDLSKGYIENFASSVDAGELPCINAQCTFTYVSAPGYYDPIDASVFKKMSYWVQMPVPDDVVNNTSVVLDAFLQDANNRIMRSNTADLGIQLRPVPVASNLSYAVKEASATRPTSVEIVVSPVGSPAQYLHPFNYKATAANVVANPSFGAISLFSCNPDDGVCRANYSPSVGQTGQLAPDIPWNVTVTDPYYLLDSGRVASLNKKISIDVRPVPKVTGLALAVAENTSFAPSTKDFVVSLGNGYTHVSNLLAHTFDVSEKNGINGTFTQSICALGVCSATYTPTIDTHGLRKFNYRVWTTDAKLGPIDSEYGEITLEVRPRPRAFDLGSESDPSSWTQVVENTQKTISLSLGSNYTHAYNTKANQIDVLSYYPANGVQPTGTCDGLGVCRIKYDPPTNYEGPAWIEYRVSLMDSVLQDNLTSNKAKIYLDVYPKPRATGRKLFVLAEQSREIKLELKTGRVLDEDDEPSLLLRKGYAHRRDDKATVVTTSDLTRGTLSQFSCGPNSCVAAYVAPVFQSNVIDSFKYKVTVGGIESPLPADYQIEVRPTATAKNLSKHTLENLAFAIDLRAGETEAYTHPIGEKATRVEILSSTNGTATVNDLAPSNAERNCDDQGRCQINFDPDRDYWTPDGGENKAFIIYRVWTFDPTMDAEVASNTARIDVDVRPIPRAVGMATAAIQGNQPQIVMAPGLLTGFTYVKPDGSSITKVKVFNVQKGTTSKNEYSCSLSSCEAIVFIPAIDDQGVAYFGNLARFDYTIVVNDPVAGSIESSPNSVQIDFRPRPIAQSVHIKFWQQSDKLLSIEPGNGYVHPYYETSPSQYRATELKVITSPNATVGDILPPGFSCSSASPFKCTATFRPNQNYYYTALGGYPQIKFMVSIQDPVLGKIDSDPSNITLEVKPIIINQGKSVRGVQTAPKIVTLGPGDGYSYPNSFDSVPPQVVVIPGTINRGTIPAGGELTCTKPEGLCTGTLNPVDATVTGLASFDYKLILNDPELGIKESATKTYSIDFYPKPKSVDFLKTFGKNFKGSEGSGTIISLLPGSWPSGAYCFAAIHSVSGVDPAYRHELCDVSAEINIISATNGTFNGMTKFPFVEGEKKWAATFQPAPENETWPGYGLASFRYQVKLMPEVLKDLTLTQAESDALLSQVSTAEVEFIPKPYATGVSLKASNLAWDYIYGVQGKNLPYTVSRCDTPATRTTCFLGYVHGYNQPANDIEFRNWSPNVSQYSAATCDSLGVCNTTLQINNNFYTTDTNYATFEYRVKVGNDWSSWVGQNVNVYPTPVAEARSSPGIEGQEITLVIDANQGYTHPKGAKAIKIMVVNAPDLAKGGLVNPSDPTKILSSSAEDVEKAFSCDPSGRCVATYRPAAGNGDDNLFYFRVQVAGPPGMPDAQAAQLISDVTRYDIRIFPKPRVQTTEVVAVEGTPTPFAISLGSGYTHRSSKLATRLSLLNGDRDASGKIVVNNGDIRGAISGGISCDSGNTSCYLACSSGTCTGFFTGLAGVYSNTIGQTPEACAVGGALCPDINFNVVVKDTGGTELEASADVPAPIRFNVRPKPTVPPLPISLKQVEGEPITITMTKPAYYGHPFYNASKITDLATTNGDLNANNFTCDTVSGRCEATFTPKASWVPGGSNIFGTIDYKVVVTDPTSRTSGPGTVGDIKSNAQGQVRIEYRPKPVASGVSFAMLEDEAQVGFRTVTIGPGAGYSHAYGLKATKIQILKDSTLQRVSIGNGTCSATSCEVLCTSDGQCSVELQPDPNYYGPGQFSFHITVLDDAFSPARELKTNTPGIVSIDIRPQPEAHNLAWNSKAGDPVAIVLANAANAGYQHPVHDYAASKVTIVTAPTAGTLSTNITCETTPGATDYRKCLGTYSPTGATYGTDSLTYKLAVYDQVLGRDIWSDQKTLTFRVRPLPIATGFAATWTTKENTPRDLVLQLGAVETDKLGYWYPNNQAPDYDVHPYSILVTQNPNVSKGSFSASGFACTSGTASPKGCQTTFTPVSNQYGPTSFNYKVQIQDPYVGLVTSNDQPINIDVRPIIRASDISYTTNTSFRTIQDQDLVWQISNGATTGYTYPTAATYNTVRDTLAIATYDRPSDGGGTILPGASCVGASGICSGTFRPTPGFFNTGTSNAAKFDFEVSVLDATLPLPMQTITSTRKTVSIDVYPKPVANNITRYTVEGQAISVAIKRAIGLGFTHARNHNPVGITVSGSNAIATLDGSNFTCTTDTCTATVTPVGYSASALAADAASFNYYVDVRETGTNPRTARSDNTGKATITVYPRSVPSFAASTQIIAFEGESASISLKKGVDIGYTHPWNDSAVGVTVDNKSTGSVVSSFTCTSGECSATFTPPLGTSASSYGDSKGWIDYKTKTTYGNLSPADVLSSTTARANFKIRAVPRVDSTWTKSGFIENTEFNFDIVRGSGFQYLDDTAYTDATIKIAYRNPTRVTCKAPISCVATNEYTCDQNGNKTCRVALTPEANWNRVDGMASLEYKIGVVDSVAGVTKWSPWSKANFPLIPRPYNPTPSGENKLIFSDGIQGSPYNFSVSLSNGYTHEEGLYAKKMWLYSAGQTNLSSPITDSSATCNATGLCTLAIAPKTTSFGAVSARGQNGTTNGSWGWSAFQYSVEHEIDGVVVTPPSSQPKGNAFVYFRPIPEKDDLNFVNAIENEEFTIQVKNKSGSCTSNCGYVFPDEFSLAGVTQNYASTIAVTAPTGGAVLTQASTCNSATGICTIKLKRTDAGPVTFTTKVTVNGVQQSVASTANVYFQARARTTNLTASTTEGTPAVIEIKKGAGYTQLDNLNAGSVLITNITNADGGKIFWMDAVDGTPTECPASGTAKLCSCVADKCIIRFVPRAWSPGEGVLTGSFKFQTRDASLKEADGVTPLSALNVSTVTVSMNPRIVTNSRSYPAGVNEGEEGVVKTVEIKEGAGGTNIGGFDHVFDHRIDFIKVVTVTGATVSGLNTWVACSAGVCNVPLTPLVDAAFVTNGGFTYHLKDLNGYESHVAGTASVYFYPRPKASSRSIVVAKNSSNNVLSIASGAGYTHALNTPASTWGRPTSPTETPAGTLSGWACDAAGNCTVNFTPNLDVYTDSGTPTKFDYRVGVTAPHGTVYSSAPHGLFSIEIFPRPVATAATKELRWVEGIGDITKPAGQQMRITIQKNIDYTHDRGSNPVKIIATNVTGGTLGTFTCANSACSADFTPTATSPDPATAAASFKLQTVVEDAVKYLAYPTDPVTYSIVIMPKPLAKAFTVQTVQGETHDFNMGSVANTSSTPKTFDSLDAPWEMGFTAPANIQITQQPSQVGSQIGTLTVNSCSSGNCAVQFVPSTQAIGGVSTFKYRVRMTHSSDPVKFDAYSDEETGTINQAYAYTVTGRQFEKQQILGPSGVEPVTEIPLTIELNNGYSRVSGYPLIQDLQITSTLSASQGTIVDAALSNGVWTAKFRSAAYWFGDINLNYRVCKTSCTAADDVKSLSSSSPATAMRIKVIPNNNPPTACNKSLVVFQNQAKRVTMERDNTSCGNGKWYGDLDNDNVSKVKFLGVSNTTTWGTFAGISVANGGDGTTCAISGSDVLCTCATAACTWQWTPPAGAVNVDKVVNWNLEAYSDVVKASFPAQTNGQITFTIKSPLQPVAEDLTFTATEDTNITVSLAQSEGYLTPPEINPTYTPIPDGYPMVPSDVIIDSHTATFRTVEATGCDVSTGICTIIVSPQWDVAGTGTVTYRIKANGLWSAPKTITIHYTAVDDAPNTYGNDERDLVLYRRLWFDTNQYLQDTKSMGTFYVGGGWDSCNCYTETLFKCQRR